MSWWIFWMLTAAVAPNEYTPRLNLTWSPNRGHRACYTDHIEAFFAILKSVRLDNDVQRYQILTTFDFRKLSFATLYPTSLNPPEMELLMQNVRTSNCVHPPPLIFNPAGFAVATPSPLRFPELVGILPAKNFRSFL